MDWIDNVGRLLLFAWLAYGAFMLLRELFSGLQDRLSRPPIQPSPSYQSPIKSLNWRTVQVAGVSYSNADGTSRQECLRRWGPTEKVWLERDTANAHDRNAVRVMTAHGQLGFLPRSIAADLAATDIDTILVEGGSKGATSNGMLGCSIRLGISPGNTFSVTGEKRPVQPAPLAAHTPPSIPSQLQATQPEAVLAPAATFKKEVALEAARSGRLKHIQLISILDRANDLGLTAEERAVFETATARGTEPKIRPSVKKVTTAFAVNRYRQGDSYESTCPGCWGAQEVYDTDNDRYSTCSRCGGTGCD